MTTDFQEEIVDIVNEQDEVIGQSPKSKAHREGLLHRTVIGEVKDSSGRWLFVKQAKHKQDVAQFTNPMGGHVKAGETIEDALKREMQEELGLVNFDYKLVGKFVFNRPVRDHIENHLFIVFESVIDTPPVLNEESVSYEYLSDEELKERVKKNPDEFGASFYSVFNKFYSHLLH